MLTFSDAKLELANLPTFVAANVDRIPSIKPEDLDIFILAQKVAAIEGQLKLQAIAADEATHKVDLDVNNEVTSGKDEEVPAKPVNTWAAAVGASLDVGRDGALVEAITLNRRVVGSTPALAVT